MKEKIDSGIKYYFNDPSDMIRLAQDVQVYVYWSKIFYLGDVEIPYKNIWDYCDDALREDCIGLVIDHDEVTFIRKSK